MYIRKFNVGSWIQTLFSCSSASKIFNELCFWVLDFLYSSRELKWSRISVCCCMLLKSVSCWNGDLKFFLCLCVCVYVCVCMCVNLRKQAKHHTHCNMGILILRNSFYYLLSTHISGTLNIFVAGAKTWGRRARILQLLKDKFCTQQFFHSCRQLFSWSLQDPHQN